MMPETFSIMDNTIASFLRRGPRRVNDEYVLVSNIRLNKSIAGINLGLPIQISHVFYLGGGSAFRKKEKPERDLVLDDKCK